jgi:hypothetical protein
LRPQLEQFATGNGVSQEPPGFEFQLSNSGKSQLHTRSLLPHDSHKVVILSPPIGANSICSSNTLANQGAPYLVNLKIPAIVPSSLDKLRLVPTEKI